MLQTIELGYNIIISIITSFSFIQHPHLDPPGTCTDREGNTPGKIENKLDDK
jgi:hypothetical protein